MAILMKEVTTMSKALKLAALAVLLPTVTFAAGAPTTYRAITGADIVQQLTGSNTVLPATVLPFGTTSTSVARGSDLAAEISRALQAETTTAAAVAALNAGAIGGLSISNGHLILTKLNGQTVDVGVLSGGGSAGIATSSVAGLVKPGVGLTVQSDGTLAVDSVAPTSLTGNVLASDTLLVQRGSTVVAATPAQLFAPVVGTGLTYTNGVLAVDSVTPAAASSVPALSGLRVLLSDGTYLTGAQLQTLLGTTTQGSTQTTAPTYASTFATTLSASSGTVGNPVTVTETPGTGGWPGGNVTPSSTLAGTFSPTSAMTVAGSTAVVTFAFTASAAGSGTITASAANITAGTPPTYTATAAQQAANSLPNIGTAPAIWLDASAPNSLYSDAARTTLQTVAGGPVAAMADMSGNGNHVAVPANSTAPVLGALTSSGKPTVVFTGANNNRLGNLAGQTWMSGLNTGGSTILLVAKPVGGNQFTYWWSVGTNGDELAMFNGQYGLRRQGPGGNNYTQGGSTDNEPNILYRGVGRSDPANSILKLSTVSSNSGEVSTGTTPPYNGSGPFTTFTLADGTGRNFTGDLILCELVIWPVVATDAQRDAMLAYATNKWGAGI
jgi:hypothetical protein